MDNLKQILEAILEVLPDDVSNAGNPLKPKELYIPQAHMKSLRLYATIVVGSRGVGKTTWTSALADWESRKIIGANIAELENASVQVGYGLTPNLNNYPDKESIKGLLEKNFNPRDIWRSVIIRWLSREINETIPIENWSENILWVQKNPENCAKIFEKANSTLKSDKKNGLILFDALDRLSDSWEEMDNLVRELLRLALELKAFTNIHAKIFLREDQLSRNVTNFPDASKLQTTKAELNWDREDLYGLLWQQLCNAPGIGGDILRHYYQDIVGLPPSKQDDYWVITDGIKQNETRQRELFEKLAGSWMGKDKRRGVPYVWTVGHLSDGNKQVSPRSFLAAIKTAADDSMRRTGDYPLHYESIKKGVRSASKIRVNEIAEDYPWIKDLCEPLAGRNVPALFNDFENIWKQKYPGGPNMIKSKQLPPQDMERGWQGIKDELIRLGVFEEMRDSRINMPDLFRVGFGLGRKGGVPPVG